MPCEFLLDDAADVNVISQVAALKWNLPKLEDATILDITSFRSERRYVYGAHRLSLRLADSIGVEKDTYSVFYAVNLLGPQVLLGRL